MSNFEALSQSNEPDAVRAINSARKKRKVHPHSLLGLLYTLRDQASSLEVRIAAVEKRLREEGVADPLATMSEVADALSRRSSVRGGGMFIGT